MSVLVENKEKYGALADYIQMKNSRTDGYFSFLTHDEKMEMEHLKHQLKDFDEYEHTENRINCFVDRLYIANQLAWYYNYGDWYNQENGDGHDKTKGPIDRLEKNDVKNGMSMNTKRALKLLNSVSYNIYTNGGNSFLSKKDSEKLDRMIEQLKSEIIRDMGE